MAKVVTYTSQTGKYLTDFAKSPSNIEKVMIKDSNSERVGVAQSSGEIMAAFRSLGWRQQKVS